MPSDLIPAAASLQDVTGKRRIGTPAPYRQRSKSRSYGFVLAIALIGIFCPAIQFDLGGALLTPGRIVTILFILPAIQVVRQRRGGLFASDVWAFLTSTWCILAVLLNGGFRPYVAVEALELFSGYIIGRAFTFGTLPLQTFIKVLKFVCLGLVVLAALDTLSGRRLTAETAAQLFSLPFYAGETQYRNGIVRATSTFPTSELFGLFCVACTSIFLYSESGLVNKLKYAGLGILGTCLSVSSGPALALGIVLGSFFYDMAFRHFPGRWKALRNAILGGLLVVFLGDMVLLNNDVTHPILWVVRNLTFDPWTGYWRVETWQHALPYILSSPFVGVGFNQVADPSDLYLRSLDSVYLVMAWRFGIPAMLLLIATIVASVSERRTRAPSGADSYTQRIRTGFSLAIVSVAIIGLTVHLWDSTWIFWSMCMGIRVSLKEYSRTAARAMNPFRSPRLINASD